MQGAPFAGLLVVGLLLRSQALGLQGQTEFNPRQRQASGIGFSTVDADKGSQVVATDEQLADRNRCGGFIGARGAGQIGQGDRTVALVDAKVARGLEETKGVQGQVAAGAGDLALLGIECQGDADGIIARAGGHGQRLRRKVDQAVVAGRALHLQRELAALQGQAVDAGELHRAGFALQRHPAAHGCLRVVDVGFLAGQGQAQAQVGQTQADGLRRTPGHASKGAGDVGAQGEQIHVDAAAVAKLEAGVALGQMKAALGLQKTKGVELERAAGLGQFTVGAVKAEGERRAGARGHSHRLTHIVDDQGFVLHRGHGGGGPLLGEGELHGHRRGAGRDGDAGHIDTGMRTAKAEQQFLTVPELDRDAAAKGGLHRCLHGGDVRVGVQRGGGVPVPAQAEAGLGRVGGDLDALLLGHGRGTLRQVVGLDAGAHQARAGGADVADVLRRQCVAEIQRVGL